jgi:hypothetical protein
MIYTCAFCNNTIFPIFVESWINKNELTVMKGITVEPGKTNQISSITGEWYLHNLLPNIKHFKIWKDAGYNRIGHIGKFRNEQAYDNNISWIDYDEFDVKLENDIYFFYKK